MFKSDGTDPIFKVMRDGLGKAAFPQVLHLFIEVFDQVKCNPSQCNLDLSLWFLHLSSVLIHQNSFAAV